MQHTKYNIQHNLTYYIHVPYTGYSIAHHYKRLSFSEFRHDVVAVVAHKHCGVSAH